MLLLPPQSLNFGQISEVPRFIVCSSHKSIDKHVKAMFKLFNPKFCVYFFFKIINVFFLLFLFFHDFTPRCGLGSINAAATCSIRMPKTYFGRSSFKYSWGKSLPRKLPQKRSQKYPCCEKTLITCDFSITTNNGTIELGIAKRFFFLTFGSS